MPPSQRPPAPGPPRSPPASPGSRRPQIADAGQHPAAVPSARSAPTLTAHPRAQTRPSNPRLNRYAACDLFWPGDRRAPLPAAPSSKPASTPQPRAAGRTPPGTTRWPATAVTASATVPAAVRPPSQGRSSPWPFSSNHGDIIPYSPVTRKAGSQCAYTIPAKSGGLPSSQIAPQSANSQECRGGRDRLGNHALSL